MSSNDQHFITVNISVTRGKDYSASTILQIELKEDVPPQLAAFDYLLTRIKEELTRKVKLVTNPPLALDSLETIGITDGTVDSDSDDF